MWTKFCVFFYVSTAISGFINVVHDKPQGLHGKATMSHQPQVPSWSADKAVDASNDQTTLTTCAVTDYSWNLNNVWWKVRLPRRFNIAYLEVYFRSITVNRASGFYFYGYDSTEVFDPKSPDPNNLIYHHDPMSGCPAPIQNITVNRLAREIVFINKRPPGYNSTCVGDSLKKTAVELCEVKVMGCDPDRFGSDECRKICSAKCKDTTCDVLNGSCKYGCSDSHALSIDCIVCPDRHFISNRKCVPCQGHCKGGAPCNKLTGRCDNGCQNYWTGDLCQTCPPVYYGNDCDTQCGKCAGNEMCDGDTGDYPKGCLGNWQEPKCNVCEDGFYDSRCNSTCGSCVNNGPCEKVTGECKYGCQLYFKPPLCQECSEGYYDINCRTPCGHCSHGSICNILNGTCYDGCINNFQEPKCADCKDGFYNSRCTSICGKCVNNEPCDKVTGECRNGCKIDFKPPMCQDNEVSFIMFYLANGIFGLLFLSAAVGVVVFLKCHMSSVRRSKDITKRRTKSGRQIPSKNYDKLTTLRESHHYATRSSEPNDSHYQDLPESKLSNEV
ncbi:uncharacterized protein LOC111115605 [Crassostrea virginica]